MFRSIHAFLQVCPRFAISTSALDVILSIADDSFDGNSVLSGNGTRQMQYAGLAPAASAISSHIPSYASTRITSFSYISVTWRYICIGARPEPGSKVVFTTGELADNSSNFTFEKSAGSDITPITSKSGLFPSFVTILALKLRFSLKPGLTNCEVTFSTVSSVSNSQVSSASSLRIRVLMYRIPSCVYPYLD